MHHCFHARPLERCDAIGGIRALAIDRTTNPVGSPPDWPEVDAAGLRPSSAAPGRPTRTCWPSRLTASPPGQGGALSNQSPFALAAITQAKAAIAQAASFPLPPSSRWLWALFQRAFTRADAQAGTNLGTWSTWNLDAARVEGKSWL